MTDEKRKLYERSLKSTEIDDFFDRHFFRPLGFSIAYSLQKTGITPNQITVISIFFGVAAGILFRPENLLLNITGFFLLLCATTLDCVDGQLARLTGIKSALGRILDGLASDLWFLSIYICIAIRLCDNSQYGSWWIVAAIAAAASNLVQSNIADYYKTLHLFLLNPDKGKEFETSEQILAKYRQISGFKKPIYFLYFCYSLLQIKVTPNLQNLLSLLRNRYGNDIPESIRNGLRADNRKVMPLIFSMTFNGRTAALLVSLLAGAVWFYLFYEIVALNAVLFTTVIKHENLMKKQYKILQNDLI
jgi:phosphatidylglycerophosphate synthase